MLKQKKKGKPGQLPPQEPVRAPVPLPPSLPDVERSFFDILLRELRGGLQDMEKDIRHLPHKTELLHKHSRLQGTVSYARALLRLEDLQRGAAEEAVPAEVSTLLNLAVNNLRRSFLYAGTAVRRPGNEPPFTVHVPQQTVLFLLEEMLACCLRCAPQGKNLHINQRPIGTVLLLSMRTEGAAFQQSPLIPLLPREEDAPDNAPAGEEDYGFAVCRVLAAQLGWAFRWDADEAGVRMFLDIRQ